MTLKFCPKCKNVLIPRRVGERDFVVKCSECDYVDKFKGKPLVEKNKIPQKRIEGKGVVEDKDSFATYKHKCKKCGYDKAEIIDVGVSYSDEDDLILLKCGKCGYSERVGRKIS